MSKEEKSNSLQTFVNKLLQHVAPGQLQASWKELEGYTRKLVDIVSLNEKNTIKNEIIKDQGFLAALTRIVSPDHREFAAMYKEVATQAISLSRAPEETITIRERILENNVFMNEVSKRVRSIGVSLEDQALASETFLNEVSGRIRFASMRVIKHTSFADEQENE